MKTSEQRDIERAELATYLNERGLEGHEAVALLAHSVGEIIGTAVATGKMDMAGAQVTIEQLAQFMQQAAGVGDDKRH